VGNFYTNFTILGADCDETLAVLKDLRRRAYVVQGSPGIAIVYDEDSDEQDVREIERFGALISARLEAPVLACLNHDDDHLLLWLFEGEGKAGSYESWLDAPAFAWSLSRVRGGVLAFPLIMVVLGWPVVLFQFLRHKALANLLSLPTIAVGYGYTYLARGEVPVGLQSDDIKKA
jgi:hypothetical protein